METIVTGVVLVMGEPNTAHGLNGEALKGYRDLPRAEFEDQARRKMFGDAMVEVKVNFNCI